MKDKRQNNISFAEFELDIDHRRLLRDGEPIALNAKTFDLLAFLVENKGRTITKDEILEAVWAGQFVEEANLTVQISALRKALGEKKDAPRFLVTVPGKGYKFVADVNNGDGEIVIEKHRFERVVINEEIEKSQNPETKQLTEGKPQNRKAVFAFVGLILFILLGFAGYRYFSPTAKYQIKSIAVLPFKPLVIEDRNEPLEMGMADTLITKLSNLREINVRPISAVRRYAGIEQDAIAAGREQQVDAVLDGQIQKSNDKIRMTIRLVRVDDGTLIWTNQFDEKMSDIFGLQDSISRRVADSLALKLSGERNIQITKHYTENPEAYQLYLLGRFHFAKRTREALAKSIEYFNQAIEKDPNYALAYVGLAAAYSTSGWNDFLLPHEAYPKAKEAIGKALRLDETIAEAHAVLGNIRRGYDWDLMGAESAYRRALELDPNNPTTYQWYGLNMSFAGQHDESVGLLRRARELDPLSMIINKSLGDALSFARRFDEAIEQYHRVLELDPHFPNVYREIGTCYYYKNMHDKAFEEWLRGVSVSGANSNDIGTLRNAYQHLGMKGFWRELAEQIKQAKVSYISSYDVASCYSAAGEKEKALDWLEKAYQEHSSGMVALNAELMFDNIRSESRFLELVRRVGLPQ
jgi:DNA-binding winged helix-turn-helix (wHTH) protein/TolB-like protein/tetratricopeptide (TPR) repeat protein